jgi:peptide deformylase
MTILKILTFPDPRLKTRARPVDTIDTELRRLMDDMLETMQNFKGIGLAAPQVNIPLRIIVLGITGADQPEPLKLVNPEILWCSDETSMIREGCLSVPQRFADVARPNQIRYGFMDDKGRRMTQEAEGLLSHVIQHEMDHLNGVLFVDHLSPLKRKILLGNEPGKA